jgi:hypothetical protein
MSQPQQFWQYAEEAMLSARYAKTDTDKRAMLDLARTWSQAALQSEGTVVVPDGSPGASSAVWPLRQPTRAIALSNEVPSGMWLEFGVARSPVA